MRVQYGSFPSPAFLGKGVEYSLVENHVSVQKASVTKVVLVTDDILVTADVKGVLCSWALSDWRFVDTLTMPSSYSVACMSAQSRTLRIFVGTLADPDLLHWDCHGKIHVVQCNATGTLTLGTCVEQVFSESSSRTVPGPLGLCY